MDASIDKSQMSEPAACLESKQLSVEEKGDVVELAGHYTEEEERRVLRKIDSTILPMMCFIFFLQYLDKQTLSYASVSTALRTCECWCATNKDRYSASSPISV